MSLFLFRPRAIAATLALCSMFNAGAATPGTNPGTNPGNPPGKSTHLPGDDFFMYVNGDWIDSTAIPADRNSWGSGQALTEATNQRLVQLIEDGEEYFLCSGFL